MMFTIKQSADYLDKKGVKVALSTLKKYCQNGFLETAQKKQSARGEYWVIEKKELDRSLSIFIERCK